MKKAGLWLLVLSLLFGLVSGCSDDSGEKANQPSGKELVIGDTEWGGMDVYQLTGTTHCYSLAISTLLTHLPDGTFGPGIVESYEVSEDGKTITLVIPDDLKYADGDALTPEDVKRSIEWGLEISPYNTDYAAINNIEIDGQSIVITLDEYAPSIMFSMAGVFMPIIPAKQLDSMTAEELLWGATPYGAYALDDYVEGSHVTLKRNPNYKTNNPLVENKGVMNIETITLRFFNDDFALMNSVVSGEIDMSYNYPTAMLGELEKNADYTAKRMDDYGVGRVFLNSDCELFADPNVREGLIRLVDREAIAEYSEGELQPAYSMLAPGTLDYSDEADQYFSKNYGYDKEEGLRMLADAGWSDTDGDGYLDKDGQQFVFTLHVVEHPIIQKIAEILQIKLWEVGVNMEMNIMSLASVGQAVATEDSYEAAILYFSWGDASAVLPYIVSDANVLSDDMYFDIIYEASASADAQVRAEGYVEAQKILMDTRCCFPLVRVTSLVVYNSKLEGAYIGDYGVFYINDVQ